MGTLKLNKNHHTDVRKSFFIVSTNLPALPCDDFCRNHLYVVIVRTWEARGAQVKVPTSNTQILAAVLANINSIRYRAEVIGLKSLVAFRAGHTQHFKLREISFWPSAASVATMVITFNCGKTANYC